MRIVSRQLVPDSSTSDLAQVLASGLLREYAPGMFRFDQAARRQLHTHLLADDAYQVARCLRAGFERTEALATFPALIADPSGVEHLPPRARALATASLSALRASGHDSSHQPDPGPPHRRTRRVFLSHTPEDAAMADQLTHGLTRLGFDIYSWTGSDRRGERFITTIAQQIATADLFVVLMSPNYLRSAWCRREMDVALQREVGMERRLIHVVTVAETDREGAGLLGQYDWLDLTPPVTVHKLSLVAAALSPGGFRPSGVDAIESDEARPVFRDRHEELHRITSSLAAPGGWDLWVVVGPPGIGKTWFLHQLSRELVSRESDGQVHLLDVRAEPLEVRTNPAKLLRRMLFLDERVVTDDTVLSDSAVHRAVAAQLVRRGRQVYLLDSAELLDFRSGRVLRSALSETYNSVRSSGPTSRMSVVIATRRHDEWQGLGDFPGTGKARFTSLMLSEFRLAVIYDALRELSGVRPDQATLNYARQVHRLTEGMPALLPGAMNRARATAGIGPSAMDRAVEVVVSEYVREHLLTADSLVPFVSADITLSRGLVERALRALVIYRLFTQSHLRHHLGRDPEFGEALAVAGWSYEDLWEAVSHTALVVQPLMEPWQMISLPIRRLLFRHFHRSPSSRAEAHATARQLYDGWASRGAGMEQGVIALECLWHEAAGLAETEPSALPERLPAAAAEITAEFVKSSMYERSEIVEFIIRRLTEDEEFSMLLAGFDGLQESVLAAISGGA